MSLPPILCPYCGQRITEPSQDHVFPQFLGGRLTVLACRSCNSGFGSTFEGRSARQLLAFQLMLRSTGISRIPVRDGTRWIGAYEHEGELHDLEVANGRLLLVPTRPKVIRDDAGRVVSVKVRSMKELKALTSRPPDGYAFDVQQTTQQVRMDSHGFGIEFGPDLGQFIAKMCVAATTLLPDFDPREVQETTSLLRTKPETIDDVRRDFRPLDITDLELPLFSHRIYVERKGGILQGRVKLFGVMTLSCLMRGDVPGAPDGAIMGTLNVLTGDEAFTAVEPVGLSEAPLVIPIGYRDEGLARWADQMQRQVELSGVPGWKVELSASSKRQPESAISAASFSSGQSTTGTYRLVVSDTSDTSGKSDS